MSKANKCTEIKAKDTLGPLTVQKMEEGNIKEDPEKKSIRLIRVRYYDLEKDTKDPFIRYWIILSNLGQMRIGARERGSWQKYSSIQVPTTTRYQVNFMK
jgi:hypothetical protein